MRSLKSVLVATNLTSTNEQLFETVVIVAWGFGARLAVLHVQACERLGDFERADRCRRRLDQLQRYPVLN